MTLEQQLISKYYQPFTSTINKAYKAYGKNIRDDKGIKYFIHFFGYNHHKQIDRKFDDIDKWEVSLQFNTSFSTINITLFSFINNKSLDEIEQYVDDLWNKLKANYYEKY